ALEPECERVTRKVGINYKRYLLFNIAVDVDLSIEFNQSADLRKSISLFISFCTRRHI
ncbi:MAG: hypothetical protein K0Q48_3566, partial [Bacillota bacterium]|nr:hypothetical protein [Bacillota bacterium]